MVCAVYSPVRLPSALEVRCRCSEGEHRAGTASRSPRPCRSHRHMEDRTLLCLRPGAREVLETLLGFRGQRTVLTAGEKRLSEGGAVCSGPSWQRGLSLVPVSSPRDWDVAAAGRSAGAGGPQTGPQVSARDTVGREQLRRCADRVPASRTTGRPRHA